MIIKLFIQSINIFFLLHKIPPIFFPFHRSACYSFLFLLDFLRGFHRINVQSTSISHSFWTSSVAHSASTSNLPLFLVPFGLQPVSQPLQRPIRLSFSFLLDFNLSPNRFNVQSATAFLFFYIYIRIPLSKSLTLHPYFPQFSHLLPTTKNSRRNKPCGSNHTLY